MLCIVKRLVYFEAFQFHLNPKAERSFYSFSFFRNTSTINDVHSVIIETTISTHTSYKRHFRFLLQRRSSKWWLSRPKLYSWSIRKLCANNDAWIGLLFLLKTYPNNVHCVQRIMQYTKENQLKTYNTHKAHALRGSVEVNLKCPSSHFYLMKINGMTLNDCQMYSNQHSGTVKSTRQRRTIQ